jgi:hypothetical protein
MATSTTVVIRCLLILYHVPVVVVNRYVPVQSILDIPSCSKANFYKRKTEFKLLKNTSHVDVLFQRI